MLAVATATLQGPPAPLAAAPGDRAVSPNVAVDQRAPRETIQDYQSPSVAVDPNNPANLAIASRFDSPDFMCQAHYSSDGGRSWNLSSFPLASRGTCWAPQIAFDDANRVFVAAQSRPPGGGAPQEIDVWTSTDGGKTFATPVVIPGSTRIPTPNCFCPFSLQAGITVDMGRSPTSHHGRLYATWYAGSAAGFTFITTHVSFSDDAGRTWSAPATRTVNGETQYLPSPTVGPEGNLYVVYKDTNNFLPGTGGFASCVAAGGGFTGKPPGTPSECPIRVLRSTNGGASFDSVGPSGAAGFPVAMSRFVDLSAYEQVGIATTPSGDVLVTFASLPDLPTPAGCTRDLDVFVTRSTDKGATWGAPVRISDDSCGSGASQRDPWISVAPDGRVDAVFYDDRHDIDHALNDAYYASSTDGGRTFGPNRRITDRSFDSRLMFTPRASGFQTKEFDTNNGIASFPGGAVAAWGDTRNTVPKLLDGDPTVAPSDVIAARVELSPSGPRPVGRIAGADRYATALALSRQTYSFAETVTLASGDRFTDVASGAPLARKGRGPLLLVPPGGLTAELKDEIGRLKPSQAYILGSTTAVPGSVEADLATLGVVTRTRLGSDDPYATAQAIAGALGAPPARTAVIVSGEQFPSATAAAAFAASKRLPVLFVTRDGIPVPTKQALQNADITKTIVVGDESEVSAGVMAQLGADGRGPTRVAGVDRYDTSARLADLGASPLAGPAIPTNIVYLTSGLDPIDGALAAAVVAYRGGTFLLADGEDTSASYLQANAARVDRAVLVGPCGAVRGMAGFDIPPAPSGCGAGGYRLVGSDGGIFAFGKSGFFGSTGSLQLNQPVVAMASTPGDKGYWLVASDGGVFAFGDAGFFGSTGATQLNKPIVAMASTPSGRGYWLVASDGGVFAFGDAGFFGSTGATQLNKPIVAMASTPSGRGYWLVASDGGVFAFGDARFLGSTGATQLNKPIVGIAAHPGGAGYWLVASDGGVFAFGPVPFLGSTGALTLNRPMVGTAASPTGRGYWLVASDGGVFAFGDAGFFGSTGAVQLNRPVVGIAPPVPLR